MDSPRDPNGPDAEALDWLDAQLGKDDAALIEALPDEAVHAELHDMGLDATRLSPLPGSTPAAPARADRPPTRGGTPRQPRWRAPWAYAIATLLLFGVVSLSVLRSTREHPTAAASTAEPEAAALPAPAAGAAAGDAASAEPPVASKRAQPAPTQGAYKARDVVPSPKSPPPAQNVPLREEDVSAREEMGASEVQRSAGPPAPRASAARGMAEIPELLRAYQAASVNAADSLPRRRLAKALAAAYTALGDTAEARRWSKRHLYP